MHPASFARFASRAPRRNTASTPTAYVLVVSEDVNLASACVRVLEEEGYAAVYARHSGHALLACLSGVPADILITELSMADGSGPALANRLRRYNPDMQTVFLANPGTLYDAGNVLVRPFTGEELLTRISAAVTSFRAS